MKEKREDSKKGGDWRRSGGREEELKISEKTRDGEHEKGDDVKESKERQLRGGKRDGKERRGGIHRERGMRREEVKVKFKRVEEKKLGEKEEEKR